MQLIATPKTMLWVFDTALRCTHEFEFLHARCATVGIEAGPVRQGPKAYSISSESYKQSLMKYRGRALWAAMHAAGHDAADYTLCSCRKRGSLLIPHPPTQEIAHA